MFTHGMMGDLSPCTMHAHLGMQKLCSCCCVMVQTLTQEITGTIHPYMRRRSREKLMSALVSTFQSKVTDLKFQSLFSLYSQRKMWFIKIVIHKMLVRIANREDPDQTASLEAV